MSETVISSFILRFIQESDADLPWRGVVRHVQSDEESRFTRMEEALRFIGRFVEVAGDTTAAGRGGQGMDVRPHAMPGLDGEE